MSGSYNHEAHVKAHARGVYYHTCRSCGCTDPFPCTVEFHYDELGPCSWVEDDLCSRCAPTASPLPPPGVRWLVPVP